jgi:hypothetical protein
MKVSEVLAHARVRLRDDNAEFTKIGDDYLMSLVYFWQNQLLAEFGRNIKEFKFTLNEQDELEVPFEMNRIIAVYLGNSRLDLTSYAAFLEKKDEGNLCVFEKAPQVLGFSHLINGSGELYAVKKAVINSKDDELILGDEFINLLTLSIVLDTMKAQISPDNSQRIALFEQVLQKERDRVCAFLARKQSPLNFQSPFIRA